MLPRHPDQMTATDLDAWIRQLVDDTEPEGPRLDYKQEINTARTTEKRELAKDITSFANEIGGTLIYGIPEDQSNPQAAPTPVRPYGINPIVGLEETLENIYASVITPLLPEYRIRRVDLTEYPGKVCYIMWTPESWIGPHMVQGYSDARFYRRGQFRTVTMSERDVEERYRRRLSTHSAAEEFLKSEDARYLLALYNRAGVVTTLMIVPLVLLPNRVAFHEPAVRQWISSNPFLNRWSPSMRGVITSTNYNVSDKHDIEIHYNGAIVDFHYTEAGDPPNDSTSIAYRAELYEILKRLEFASKFYDYLGYVGPLIVSIDVLCPVGYALFLPRHRPSKIPLEPSGTDIRIRFEVGAAQLVSQPNAVLRRIGDEMFRAFGIWEADCFDNDGNITI